MEAQVVIPTLDVFSQFKDRYTRQHVLAKPFVIYRQVLIGSLVDDRRGKYDGRLCDVRLANDEEFF